MSVFNSGIRVILQRLKNGRLVCECFGGIPSPDPVLISVLPAGGSKAEGYAEQAGDSIFRALRAASLASGTIGAPCGARSYGPVSCNAHAEPTCHRLLVLTSDGTSVSSDSYGAIAHWADQMTGSQKYVAITSLPEALRFRATTVLPHGLGLFQAHFWKSDPGEVAAAVFSAAGITTDDYRVFISYRRGEGQSLADQLFDELNRRNFEVFLDQFRIDPGVNFQERLTEELARKSMVVLLETKTIDQSRWVGHEVVYAVKNRLGLLAVQVSDGVSRPEVDNRRRIEVARHRAQ